MPNDKLKLEAARALVALFVEGRPLPAGLPWDARPEPVPTLFRPASGAGLPAYVARIVVTCDFVPADAVLGSDPRLERTTQEERDAIFARHRYGRHIRGTSAHGDAHIGNIDYLTLTLDRETETEIFVLVRNFFGVLAGRGFRVCCDLYGGELAVTLNSSVAVS